MASTSDEISMVAVDMETQNSRISRMAKNMQKELMDDMLHKLGSFGGESEESDQEYMFSRVLDSVRKVGERDYEPRIISIGPIHRDNETLKPMEALKQKYLSELIGRNPEENTLEKYLEVICSVEEKARKLYSESAKMGDDFVEMMVLDGCFLIEFLVKVCTRDNRMDLTDNGLSLSLSQNLPLLRRDLLLLENQIPFFILKVLFNSTSIHKSYSGTLEYLIAKYVFCSDMFMLRFRRPRLYRFVNFLRRPKERLHLLHAYHESLNPYYYHTSHYTMCKKLRRIWRFVAAPFLWLLSCMLTCKIRTLFLGDRRRDFFYIIGPKEIPSATQLCNCGVNFKKSKSADGEECLSVDVTFDKEEGILEMPVFSLQEAQISTFRNLTAFEQVHPRAGNHVRSHALLMACLVRTAEDVAILRDSGIIESSMLKKDNEVVDMFAQFLRDSHLDFGRHDNPELFEEVLEYCGAVHHKWRAEFKRTYFGNPWTVASLIAAILILLLTFAQTFYTIYAYYQPRST